MFQNLGYIINYYRFKPLEIFVCAFLLHGVKHSVAQQHPPISYLAKIYCANILNLFVGVRWQINFAIFSSIFFITRVIPYSTNVDFLDVASFACQLFAHISLGRRRQSAAVVQRYDFRFLSQRSRARNSGSPEAFSEVMEDGRIAM